MTRKNVTRRTFLQGAAGMAGGSVLMLRSRRAWSQTTVGLTGWAFAPEVVRENLDRFESMAPDYRVEMQMFAPADYGTRIVALAAADQLRDVLYVRGENLVAWVSAGYLQPIDDLAGIDEVKSDLFPFVQSGMSVEGKLYGLPYFTDIQVFYYNEQMLGQAGIDTPPASLDDLREQSLALKEAGVAEYPLIFGFKKATWSNLDWWTMVFASGGRLFDDELEPVFPDKDQTAIEVLQWMVDAIHTWKIADPAAVELDVNQTRDLFGAGRYAFVMQHRYDESRYNNPELASASGQIRMGMIPGFDGTTRGTFGIVRMYGLANTLSDADGCVALLNYLGGKDSEGRYHTAANWFEKFTLGYGVKGLDADPAVQALFDKFGNADVKRSLAPVAKVSELQLAPWGAEWESFNYDQIQAALIRKVSPREALEASAERARELRKRWQ